MKQLLCVFLAGGLGSTARYAVGILGARALGTAFPFGTLTVNVLGSFAMAVVVAWAGRGLPDLWRLTLATGFLGGFTTYSSFNQETWLALSEGNARQAVLYVGTTLSLCLVAAFLGMRAAKLVWP